MFLFVGADDTVSAHTNMYQNKKPHLPLLLADPELMERTQTREDTPTQPSTELSLNRITRRMNFSLFVRIVNNCLLNKGRGLFRSFKRYSTHQASNNQVPLKVCSDCAK